MRKQDQTWRGAGGLRRVSRRLPPPRKGKVDDEGLLLALLLALAVLTATYVILDLSRKVKRIQAEALDAAPAAAPAADGEYEEEYRRW